MVSTLTEFHASAGRLGLASDGVEQRGFPRTIRPDDGAPLSVGNAKTHVFQSMEAVERFAEAGNRDRRHDARSLSRATPRTASP